MHIRALVAFLLLPIVSVLSAGPATGQARQVSTIQDASPQFELQGRILLYAGVRELWVTDGTPGGTVPLATREMLGSLIAELTKVGEHAFFTDVFGRLWVTDSTPAGTQELRKHPCQLAAFTAIGDRLLYVAGDADSTELWESDGTSAGTVKVADLPFVEPFFPPGRCLLPGFAKTSSEDRFFLFMGDALVTSDGTEQGTRTLLTSEGFCPSPHCLVRSEAAAVGDFVYLVVDRKNSLELWRVDGVTGKRVLLHSFADPGAFPPAEVGYFMPVGERLFFRATAPGRGVELWVTDMGGTRLVRDVNPGPDGSEAVPLFPMGDRLVFVANDGRHGLEPWLTDGTPRGTFLLRDIRPGFDSSFPHASSVDGVLLFTADDGQHGAETWVSDGAPDGTRLLVDFAEGGTSSFPGGYVASGDEIFVHVSFPESQRGLWAFPRDLLPAPAPPYDPPCPQGFACLLDGRFQVEIRYWNQHGGTGGFGEPISLSDETALFYFFKPENVEVLVKVLDARRQNGHFWVFLTGLTDLYFEVSILDTSTGESRIYTNQAGEICGQADVMAFADP